MHKEEFEDPLKEYKCESLKEYLRKTAPIHDRDKPLSMESVRYPVRCKDGFTISIQASKMHYCHPREDLITGEYTHLELGFPSKPSGVIKFFAEDFDNLTETIYPYVPIHRVQILIDQHGGIADEEG